MIVFALILSLAAPALAEPLYIGRGNGTFDLSVGVFFSRDDVDFRNLSLRADFDIAPHLRYHGIVRSNRDFNGLSQFQPRLDENNLELFDVTKHASGTLSLSLKLGRTRYLRYPYPDAIATFDLPPGVEDLKDDAKKNTYDTGFTGAFPVVDYALENGLGVHASYAQWGFGANGRSGMMENYLFLRRDFGSLHFETHAGRLINRHTPVPTGETGFNVYLGARIFKNYTVGLLYEKLNNNPFYTGIMVSLAPSNVTRAMGKVAFDYDRSPEGFAMQIPILSGKFGNIAKNPPEGAVLVGEIQAKRIRTYWQNGQVRNYYEHRISSWGQTGDGYKVVMKEEPWYLESEALVSPHSFSNLSTWEKDRRGPAQLVQIVVYQFYRQAAKL